MLASTSLLSQGIINNGAKLVFDNDVNIIVDGTSGNFINQSAGTISNITGNGIFQVKGNWTNNAANTVFTTDGIFTELNGSAQTIGGTNSTTFHHLKLAGSGTKTLDNSIKVGGITTLDGILALTTRPLDLNQHTLEITNPSTAAITRTSGFIISETNAATNPSIIQWNTDATVGNYVFPFGAAGDFIPVLIDKTNAVASDISVSTRATTANTNAPWATGVTHMTSALLGIVDASEETAIDRWYEISVSNPLVADVTLSYRGAENTTTTSPTGTFAVQRWNGSWEPQQGVGIGVTTGVGNVVATGVSEFSTFVLTTLSTSGPLPITLTHFSANCEDGKTTIKWITASESNSDKFVVKRSRDGKNWEIIGELNAAGNSNQELHYAITDAFPIPGTSYYLLEQHDLNGEVKSYNPISSDCQASLENSLSVYPNPTNNGFKVEINQLKNSEIGSIQLFDISGKIIETRDIQIESGTNQYVFETTQLAPGTYILNILSAEKFNPVKVIILE